MQYAFDAGHMFVTPAGGSPVRIGSLQSITIDIQRSLTVERTAFQVPVAIAHKETRLKGVAKMAQINGALFGEIFFGQATIAGATKYKDGCAFTIPASPAYTVTVIPPSGGVFFLDLGVRPASDAPQFVRVNGVPTAGQYSVTGNVYTFASANAGAPVLISYAYTVTSGKTCNVQNPFWSQAPTFEIVCFQEYAGKQTAFRFPFCVSEHLSIATVLENWSLPEFTFEVLSNSQGLVVSISTAE